MRRGGGGGSEEGGGGRGEGGGRDMREKSAMQSPNPLPQLHPA